MNMIQTLTTSWRQISRKAREVGVFARAIRSGAHPVAANIVVTRRCNLSCTYCNQYDKVSEPVAFEEMSARIAKLGALGTTVITLTGGEPLLHPRIADLVREVRKTGAICILNTNGYLLTDAVVESLNEAGLDYLFISVDNLKPDEDSQKSLKVLDKKLQLLASRGTFGVTVNSVLGGRMQNPEEAYEVARRAQELGLNSTVGVLLEAGGSLVQLNEPQRAAYEKAQALKDGRVFNPLQYDWFQANLVAGRPNQWHCPAGGRFLYICESGLVHYCSQQRGRPGIPLLEYTQDDLMREGAKKKGCTDFCTISCVQQTALVDSFRSRPAETLERLLDGHRKRNPHFETPLAVRALDWLFIRGPLAEPLRRGATALMRPARIAQGIGSSGSSLGYSRSTGGSSPFPLYPQQHVLGNADDR